jgi:hypothetical protein
MRSVFWLGLAAVGLLTGAASAVDSIRPGYWSTTNSILKPVSKTKTENRCITPTAISRFMGCYINHHYKCICPEESTKGGKIVFHGDCVDAKGGHVLLRGEGTYTPTTLALNAEGDFPWMGLKLHFVTQSNDHWLSDTCPPGAPGSDGR